MCLAGISTSNLVPLERSFIYRIFHMLRVPAQIRVGCQHNSLEGTNDIDPEETSVYVAERLCLTRNKVVEALAAKTTELTILY